MCEMYPSLATKYKLRNGLIYANNATETALTCDAVPGKPSKSMEQTSSSAPIDQITDSSYFTHVTEVLFHLYHLPLVKNTLIQYNEH